MSFGTDFTCNIFLRSVVVEREYELDEHIKEAERTLERLRQMILMFAASNPKDIAPDDWSNERINFIHSKVTETLEEIEQYTKLLTDLNYYKETNPFKDKP